MVLSAGDLDVVLQGVTKRYDEVLAVRGVDLAVKRGEFVSLLGPSGCGKTTTLRLIAGFEQPDDGAIRIGDEDVQALPPHKRNVNTVFQSYALFPHLNVLATSPTACATAAFAARSARAGRAACSAWCGSRVSRSASPPSSQAASSSGSHSRARS